jgi:hypothetical protein
MSLFSVAFGVNPSTKCRAASRSNVSALERFFFATMTRVVGRLQRDITERGLAAPNALISANAPRTCRRTSAISMTVFLSRGAALSLVVFARSSLWLSALRLASIRRRRPMSVVSKVIRFCPERTFYKDSTHSAGRRFARENPLLLSVVAFVVWWQLLRQFLNLNFGGSGENVSTF